MEISKSKIKLSAIEAILKKIATVGTVKLKEKRDNLKPVYFFNIFEIKKELPNFLEFIDENYLKELSKKFGGPLFFVGGTTELEIPAFLRKESYFMNEEEFFLRFLFPSEFKTYEIFVDSNKIEARIFYKKRICNNYFFYEHYLKADGTEEITKYSIKGF